MKYVIAGVATALLFATSAMAQPTASVGGAVDPNAVPATPSVPNAIPPTPPSAVDPGGRALPLDTRSDERLKPAQPSASGSGTADVTTPDSSSTKAKGKAKTSKNGTSASGGASTTGN